MVMCAFSFFVKVRFAMSSIHCSVLPSSPRRLRSSSSNVRSSASMSTTGSARLSFRVSTFIARPLRERDFVEQKVRRSGKIFSSDLLIFLSISLGGVRVDLHRYDSLGRLLAQLHQPLRGLGRRLRRRGRPRLVRADALAHLGDLPLD